jgi:magnesium chelatase family protein
LPDFSGFHSLPRISCKFPAEAGNCRAVLLDKEWQEQRLFTVTAENLIPFTAVGYLMRTSQMLGRAYSPVLFGIDAVGIDVETQINSGLKRFTMVGLPDGVLKEARERVRCALENSGFGFPSGDVVVNLSPAALPKSGSGFDVAIALSILAAQGLVSQQSLDSRLLLGELALDGTIKPAKGVLAAACLTKAREGWELLIPEQSAAEAVIVDGITVRCVSSLLDAVMFLNGEREIPVAESIRRVSGPPSTLTFGDVVGQYEAKRALEIVAAGGHNLLMVGPPGAGKSMLAARLRSILPPLVPEEQIEVTKIYAAHAEGGGTSARGRAQGLIVERPFRAPHHSTSTAGLIGGGSSPLPGEISLAHRGVLFLDEITEMRREALEALRLPMESRQVTISRAKMRLCFPSDFILVAAMNPCPCGQRGLKDRSCACPSWAVSRYVGKISGPISDRIDLQIWVPPVPIADMHQQLPPDPTATMKHNIQQATEIQRARLRGRRRNAHLNTREVREFCRIDSAGQKLLEKAGETLRLSARGYTRMLKVARTIADLDGSERILPEHISETLKYRVRAAKDSLGT